MPKPPRLTPRANAFGGGLARSKRAVYSACFGLKNAVTRPVLGVKMALKMCAGRGGKGGWEAESLGVREAAQPPSGRMFAAAFFALLPPFREHVCGDVFRWPCPPSGGRLAEMFFGAFTLLPAHGLGWRKTASKMVRAKGGTNAMIDASRPPSGEWFRKAKMEGGQIRGGVSPRALRMHSVLGRDDTFFPSLPAFRSSGS